jgi:hypothetical protein
MIYMIPRIAHRVAGKLLTDLKGGKTEVIGIGEIRQALQADPDCPPEGTSSYLALEELTVRKVVESV